MPNNQLPNATLLSLVLASFLGLASLALLVLNPTTSADGFAFRKPLIGSVFLSICVLGGLAVILPKECNSLFGSQEKSKSFSFHSASSGNQVLKGHHVDCERFLPHTMKAGGRVLCAACSGLFLGALIAIAGTVAYFFLGLDFGQSVGFFVTAGVGLVALGFVQFKFPGLARLLVNAFFVVGASSILLGVDALLQNLLIDLYIISLVLLWIMTRILLSQWDHSRICRSCTNECEMRNREGLLSASHSVESANDD